MRQFPFDSGNGVITRSVGTANGQASHAVPKTAFTNPASHCPLVMVRQKCSSVVRPGIPTPQVGAVQAVNSVRDTLTAFICA